MGDKYLYMSYFRICFIYWMELFAGTVPANNTLFAGTVPENNTLFAGTVPENNTLFAGTANPGGGLKCKFHLGD